MITDYWLEKNISQIRHIQNLTIILFKNQQLINIIIYYPLLFYFFVFWLIPSFVGPSSLPIHLFIPQSFTSCSPSFISMSLRSSLYLAQSTVVLVVLSAVVCVASILWSRALFWPLLSMRDRPSAFKNSHVCLVHWIYPLALNLFLRSIFLSNTYDLFLS